MESKLNEQEEKLIHEFHIESIPTAIVDGQTLKVDVVSGATVTSEAIIAAVEDCITQAGADVANFK